MTGMMSRTNTQGGGVGSIEDIMGMRQGGISAILDAAKMA
jgi:hypothetical protein